MEPSSIKLANIFRLIVETSWLKFSFI